MQRYAKRWFEALIAVLCLMFFRMAAGPGAIHGQPLPEGGGEKAEVMILGTAHFSNPGQDMIKTEFPDVMKPEYQSQIRTVVDSLAVFRPTKIAVEVRPDYEETFDSLYRAYRRGEHSLERGEQQQLGFRLAGRFDHRQLYAIDHEGDLPGKALMSYARDHDPAFLKYITSIREEISRKEKSLYARATIREILRVQNGRENLSDQRGYYARIAPVGDDSTWVGADLVAQWHRRNIKIFADLAREVEPGDRVIVIFGAGHAPLLRYFVKSSKAMKIVDPLDYL